MSRAHSSFIPADQLEGAQQWDFGAVDQAALRFAAKLKAQADAEEKARNAQERQAGHSEGYAEGYAQGHAAATLEGQRQIQDYIANEGAQAARNFLRLMEQAQGQLAEAEQTIAQGALELACELARQVLRHELATNPNALLPVVREAVGLLAADSKAAVVRLNPVDVEVFAEVLHAEFPGLALTLLPDSGMARGGCQVEAAGSVVDGTVERRWAKAVASLGLDSDWEAGHEQP